MVERVNTKLNFVLETNLFRTELIFNQIRLRASSTKDRFLDFFLSGSQEKWDALEFELCVRGMHNSH